MRTIRGNLTFRRIFPYAFFVMIFALVVRQSTLIDPDLWWHLQAGQDIFNSQSIPHVDIYSFTKAGSEWVTHEWLSELLIYGVYKAAGWPGLLCFFAGIVTLALAITYRRCEGRPYAAAAAITLAAAASAPLFGVRPQMITLLFASIYLAILSSFASDGRTRRLWWLIPIMALWVNMHAGFALGLGLIGLFMISNALDRKWQVTRKLALVFLACAAVVPLNPNGFRMFSYPFETLRSPAMSAFIDEWASPNFHDPMFLPFALMLFTLLTVLAVSYKRIALGDLFMVIVAALGALRSGRHIPIFALIAAPVIAEHLWNVMTARGWEKKFTRPEQPVRAPALVFSLLFLIAPATLAAVRVWHFEQQQRAYEAQRYPVEAVDFIKSSRLPAPIYNEYTWGGYLIRKLHPDYRVYIDGRADVYGDAFLMESQDTYNGQNGWRDRLDHWGIQTVLVAPHAPLASLLRADNRWTTAFEDGQAVVFSKSTRVSETDSAAVVSRADGDKVAKTQ